MSIDTRENCPKCGHSVIFHGKQGCTEPTGCECRETPDSIRTLQIQASFRRAKEAKKEDAEQVI
jgi:hypothetical protein